jgi:hypothetical protein
MPQQIAMTPLAGIASGVERGLNAVSTMQDIEQKKQAIAINNMKMQEEQARQADMNKVTSKQILFDNLQMGENVRKSVEPFYGMFANPDGNITKKNTFEMMKFLESNPMAKQKMLEGRHADVQKEYDNSKLMLEEAKQSGNPKKIQQATQNYNMASQKLSGITQAMTDEKGNRLALIGKYGSDAERFYNGEMTADEFSKAVQARELAKQTAKDEQAIEKVRETEKIRTASKERIEAMKQASKGNTDNLSDRDKKTVETAFKYEGAARKKLDELNNSTTDYADPVYLQKANALVDIVKQQMKIHQDIINKKGGQDEKDKFGYTIGEVRKGHKYIGNDQWQKL